MKRGCFVSLLIWGACAYGYWYFAAARLVGPLRWAGPLIAGLVMTLVIGALRNAITSGTEAARFARQADNAGGGVIGERPKDGEVITVSGHIRASGSPMRTPFTGRPAVLYTYDITHVVTHQRSAPSEVNDFSGFGLSNATLDTSYGPIRILGFPNMEGIGREAVDEATARDAAQKYVVDTEFTPVGVMHLATMYGEVKSLLFEGNNQMKKDWSMSEPKPAAGAPDPDDPGQDAQKEWLARVLDGRSFYETVIAPGEQVSVIGRYSAEKGGVVPDSTQPIEMLRGDARAAAGVFRGKMIAQIAGALIFGALLNGVVFGVLKLHKPGPPLAFSPKTIEENTDAMFEATRQGNVARLEQLVKGGMPVDSRDNERKTPLMVATQANVAAWLVAHGADVNAASSNGETALMRLAQYGSADVVKLLVKSGAKVETKDPKYKLTALQYALLGEKLDNAQVLRDAGATDETVTEKTGHAVGEGSDEVRAVRDYIDAIQHEDRSALASLSTLGSFSDVDFKVWKSSRFASGRVVSGFANDNAATIEMRGATPGGVYVTWTYQLARTAVGWKVSDERWETRLSGSEP